MMVSCLVVLLAEDRRVRLDEIQQLDDHGRHTLEVAGPEGTTQDPERSGTSTMVLPATPSGYISSTVGREQRVHALPGEQRRVLLGVRG